jgi:hypothetical protein
VSSSSLWPSTNSAMDRAAGRGVAGRGGQLPGREGGCRRSGREGELPVGKGGPTVVVEVVGV